MQLIPPMRFRHHPDDHEKYGDGWYVYDESALTRVPARELIAIGKTIGMDIVAMMRAIREPQSPEFLEATLAQMWVSRRLAGVNEPFESYEPLVYLANWELVPGDVDPPEEPRSPSSSAE